MIKREVVQRPMFYPSHKGLFCWRLLHLCDSFLNTECYIPMQSSLAASSRHWFPFNCWKKEGESREKKRQKREVGRVIFRNQQGTTGCSNHTNTWSCYCQPFTCSSWYLMLSIIPFMHSPKEVNLHPFGFTFQTLFALNETWQGDLGIKEKLG